ncbi:histidine kinase [Sinomonas atrocyanea]|uniref:Histidine kinase n=1 Tax=Sinomonas atrocyanea TaxID=37927 RepID=A0A127A5F3_9MICC|nr:GAF and ANTAR domain-containing protein [Sinomonas atrocyanea]AMM34700.1 histidine kinase [Sinomonas atrocyanea]GEB64083.1 transcription antitermination regulator [Sinomonas atrocyanea]GGG67662.1 transcription antitermination regulator [Sinomonas atrocyanea]
MTDDFPLAQELAWLTARLADLLLTRESAEEAVQSLALAAKEAIPHASGAGATLIDGRGRKTSTGATDEVVLEADRLQYEMGQGLCLSAWAEGTSQTIEDIGTETRWPLWTRAAASLGLRSALSAPLISGGTPIGAMKVYSDKAGMFSAHDLRLLEMLARPAAIMLANLQARDAAQRASALMTAAIADRDAIRMATGIIMERERLGPDEALSRIIDLSRLEQRALSDTAQDIVAGRPVL